MVVTNDTPEAVSKGPFVYRVPAGSPALHVILDAPMGTTGRSDVLGVSDGADCKITVTARGESAGGFEVDRSSQGSRAIAASSRRVPKDRSTPARPTRQAAMSDWRRRGCDAKRNRRWRAQANGWQRWRRR